MKKHVLLLFLTLLTLSLYAQKYKVKKGEIQKDKKLVATYEGKLSLIKTADLAVNNKAGETILTVKEDYYSTDYPKTDQIGWFTLYFPQLDKEMIIEKEHSYINEKQFFKYVFEKRGIHFYPEGFDEDELMMFKDYSQQLNEDTLAIEEKIKFYQTKLTSGDIERDRAGEITFGYFKDSDYKAIFQKEVEEPKTAYEREFGSNEEEEKKSTLIGRYLRDKVEGISSVDPAKKDDLYIYKLLPEPVVIEGEETRYVLAGYVNLEELMPDLFLFQTGKNADYRFQSREYNDIVKEACTFMVQQGFL